MRASTPSAPSRSARTGEPSKHLDPARRAGGRASPSASRAGCTVAEAGVEGAAAEGRRGAAGGHLRRGRELRMASAAPSSRQASSARPRRGRGRRRSRPAGSRPAGTRRRPPPARRTRRSPATASLGRAGDRQRRLVAPAPPHARQREPHRVAEAAVATARPAPAGSASSRTTRASGSSCLMCQAAHRPVKPPPMTTTSASRSPASGGAGSTVARLLQPVAVWGVLHRLQQCRRTGGRAA